MLPNRTGVSVGFLLFALTCRPVPGVASSAPRERGSVVALKKSPGRKLGAANWSGTPSQLISRRPVSCATGAPPLLGSPSSARYAATIKVMSPAPATTVGEVVRIPELVGAVGTPYGVCADTGPANVARPASRSDRASRAFEM